MAFIKTVADRELVAEKLREKLPWARVIAGAKGYPFLKIEAGDRQIMWDTKEFDPPVVLERIERPGCTEAFMVIQRAKWDRAGRGDPETEQSGKGWVTFAVLDLASFAEAWLI